MEMLAAQSRAVAGDSLARSMRTVLRKTAAEADLTREIVTEAHCRCYDLRSLAPASMILAPRRRRTGNARAGGRVSEPLFRSATEVAGMVRRKEISSRELTGMLLARIDAVNPGLNAVVELRGEEALAAATRADEALARDPPSGPLHGVPMTIKDSFNVAGLHTTWGNPAFKDYVAEDSATVVHRLEQAGAIVVGKTNLAFMLADFAQSSTTCTG
jgi:hypothetical protein